MNSSLEDPDGTCPSFHFHRRQFLALSSAGILAPFVSRLAWAEPLAREVSVRPMSLGYIDGSETFLNLRRLPLKVRRPLAAAAKASGNENVAAEPSPVIVPAAGLAEGDTELPGRPLRVRVHGLYPSATVQLDHPEALPLAADLEFLFPSPDPAFPQPYRFLAWSFRKTPVWSPSPPVSFRFPLEWESMPQLVLRVRPAKGEPMVLRTTFTVDAEPGRPRLRRGTYVLGLQPSVWDRGGVKLTDLARRTPAELVSVLVSLDPEEAE